MRRTLVISIFIIIGLMAAAMICTGGATLSPLSFGFPAMIQMHNATAFNKVIGNTYDLESADISPFGSSTFGFPSISQSAIQGQSVAAVEFSQNTVFSAFSYPSTSTGLGFAGFNSIPGFGQLL